MSENLSGATMSFAISNTPLFLVSRLRADPAVGDVSRWPSRRILSALRRSLKKRPTNLESAVRPYVYLVALAQKQDAVALQEAAGYEPGHAPWYIDICDFLARTMSPTVFTKIDCSQPAKLNIVPRESSVSTEYSHIDFQQKTP